MASTPGKDREWWYAPSRWLTAVSAVLCSWLVLSINSSVEAQLSLKPRAKTGGSSYRADRKEAEAAIPYSQLTPEAARRIQAVVNKPSVYRRMPVKTIECDAQLFLFLIRNPEVVVDIWKLMGVTQLTMDRTGEFTFTSTDGAGTTSNVELVYGTPETHIYYGTGSYEGPLFKNRIKGACVLVLQADFRTTGGRQVATSRLDMFMQIEQNTVEVFAKTFQPLLGKAADTNFVETAKFLEKLSRTANLNGDGMVHMSNRLTGVSQPVRVRFGQVASTVNERSPAAELHATAQRPVRPATAERPAGRNNREAARISGFRPTTYR